MEPASGGHHPMIRGERVWLRPSEPTDIDLFLGWLNDAETAAFLALRSPIGRAAEERWVERMLESHGKDTFHFVMCRLSDDRPIGSIALHEVDHVNGNAGVGVAIGEKPLWGKGYGTDAMNALLDFAFGELRLERVWLDVYAGNERGQRSYLKSGFTLEGTLRRAHFARGEYLDVHRMGILRAEWLALPRPRSWELTARDLPRSD
ncbi:MAG: GNAT family N-acetyltransferase [Chloroflexi bacterium]|nr:GNAT family N-acetyltransferase [Chloroflexota bacterium]